MRRRPPGARARRRPHAGGPRVRGGLLPTRSTSGWPSCWATQPGSPCSRSGAVRPPRAVPGERPRSRAGPRRQAQPRPRRDRRRASGTRSGTRASPLDHSVRTPKEARAVADRDLKAALGLLDGRVVAGDAALGDGLLTRIRDDWRDRARNRLPGFGELVERTPPVVGRRRVRARTRSQGGTGRQPRRRRAARPRPGHRRVRPRRAAGRRGGTLFDARVALQRLAGRTDRLLLEHQDDVAARRSGSAMPTS